MESADPRGSGVRVDRGGLVQGVLEPKESYPGQRTLPPTCQTLAPWGPSSGSGTGSGGVFGPHWVQTGKSLISLRKRKDFEGSAESAGDPKSLPRETWRASGASSSPLGGPWRVLRVIVGVFGGPLGLHFGHLGAPGRSLGIDFDDFRVPRKASGPNICIFVIQHFNFPVKMKTAPTWSRPTEIFRSKDRFIRTSMTFLNKSY